MNELDGPKHRRTSASGRQQGTILVSEIFGVTIQGEGALIGRPTVFVRTGGCDFSCRWCDSKHAVLPAYKHTWRPLQPREVLYEIWKLSPQPILITLSGGNPAIQPLGPLIHLGKEHGGYTFTMETQGSIVRPWFTWLDYLTVSPKPPSSGMQTNWLRLSETLRAGPKRTSLKVVVFDEADYQYAREVGRAYPGVPLYLSVGNHTPPDADGQGTFDREGVLARYRWLIDRACADAWHTVTILPQMHTWLWANERGR